MENLSKKKHEKHDRKIAYFSMEIGFDSRVPTYSGGLGVLAGDTIKSAADLNVPIVAVSLLHEAGYFYQQLDDYGEQNEMPVHWSKDDFLTLLEDSEVMVKIEGRDVKIRAWQFDVEGVRGHSVPIIFLDTNIEGNSDYDRELTSHLYGGDEKYRFCQEVVLGIGGVKMLDKLGFNNITRYHMNEGHAALLTVELLNKLKSEEEVKKRCVFTTHTPVPAGHDRFPVEMVRTVLPEFPFHDEDLTDHEGKTNMTLLALHFSHYVNGVAKKHGEVSRKMFPGYPIDSITNGVHSGTWVSEPFAELFDKHIPGWKKDPFSLKYAAGISSDEILNAHYHAKRKLIDYVNSQTNAGMDKDFFTIGFARRATPYKRADLLLRDINKLKEIAEKHKLQIIYAGKAHVKDGAGKDLIKKIFSYRNDMGENIKLVYLENYNIDVAKLMVSGVDIWLNTPQRPKEASGTSGMKAAHNGVPSLSVLDGWWIEGHVEDVTGWSIGPLPEGDNIENDDNKDANEIYVKLERILPLFDDKEKWAKIMKNVIAMNASFFNTHRMVQQYVLNAYTH